MSNIINDYLVVRSQVSKELVNDADLKRIFKDKKYDIVETLLYVEEVYNGNKQYLKLEQNGNEELKDDSTDKIKELRLIANEKDKLMETIKQNYLKNNI